ncbi:hypothetical protein B0H17DRAFT_1217101 [Mycena rosella]|uniref:Reverse transcriptase zinc-binding domain-containing protein n=1 Tax=Mycena rosella TaxID=1033263 RepID=A0AAD7FQP5_MYCRO|nr:hypothetical protein B0H17DRAFT_1217101 [Mycena rosella]
MNGRSYYRWILALVSDNLLHIVYTCAHTDDQSVPSRINSEADHYASSAQRFLQDVPCAPVPTFFMDDFCFYTTSDGWIESSIRTYINKSIAASASHQPANGHQLSYSAIIQLYVCSGQLPTADILYSRGKLTDPCCRMGCAAIEDAHHVFVECAQYDEWRTKATEELHHRVNAKLAEKDFEEAECTGLLTAVKSFFSDNDVWPLHYSTYYLGHILRFDDLMPAPSRAEDSLTHSRLAHHFAADWHTAFICLAGCIWGDWQKEMSKRMERVDLWRYSGMAKWIPMALSKAPTSKVSPGLVSRSKSPPKVLQKNWNIEELAKSGHNIHRLAPKTAATITTVQDRIDKAQAHLQRKKPKI